MGFKSNYIDFFLCCAPILDPSLDKREKRVFIFILWTSRGRQKQTRRGGGRRLIFTGDRKQVSDDQVVLVDCHAGVRPWIRGAMKVNCKRNPFPINNSALKFNQRKLIVRK